ncbi:hypothetical protein AK830_g7091 [Neonectria ditissima]|uniref:Uncharacterized protein n=1 Tax=Neonectria ditissima TaxID=78410 RepID=A0A0P7BEX9_9HYPO|nr:hypothetical protein AK830_g7091 [Neonectria ditissima]
MSIVIIIAITITIAITVTIISVRVSNTLERAMRRGKGGSPVDFGYFGTRHDQGVVTTETLSPWPWSVVAAQRRQRIQRFPRHAAKITFHASISRVFDSAAAVAQPDCVGWPTPSAFSSVRAVAGPCLTWTNPGAPPRPSKETAIVAGPEEPPKGGQGAFPQSGRSSAANKGRFPQSSRAGALAQRTASVAIVLGPAVHDARVPMRFSYKRPGCAAGCVAAGSVVRYRIASHRPLLVLCSSSSLPTLPPSSPKRAIPYIPILELSPVEINLDPVLRDSISLTARPDT